MIKKKNELVKHSDLKWQTAIFIKCFFILAQKCLGCISAEKCQMSISNFQIDHYDRLIDGSTFLGSQIGAGWNFKNGR